MAGSSLLALIDDIATILDDVAVLSKVALEKTAGVVGDDLALNAKQVVGVEVSRELPVVWAVAKGSLLNKVILVPVALAISAFLPIAVTPLLMLGGAFLCFEGCEKLFHKWLHRREANKEVEQAVHLQALTEASVDIVALEKQKIKGAIRTDFVLSAEIIVIALGIVAKESFRTQVAVMTTIAVLMTIGVYGLVACIIKLDDAGLYLSARTGNRPSARMLRTLGRLFVVSAPWLMKSLAVAGTAAMFMVGGGILTHGVPAVHHWIEHVARIPASVAVVGGVLEFLVAGFFQAIAGILAGTVLVGVSVVVKRLWKKDSETPVHG